MSDTASAHDELVERMVSAMLDADNALPHSAPDFAAYARAALSVARREIREECARVADGWYGEPDAHPTIDNAIQMVKHACGVEIAAAIRAME
jgi:hypothetical protein